MSGDDRVDQIVVRWDSRNRSGGQGPVAYSCSAADAERIHQMVRPALIGDLAVPVALARVRLVDGRIAMVRRVAARDDHGRPAFQSHALVGDPRHLPTRICLGIGWSGWSRLEAPLDEVRGRLAAPAAEEVREQGSSGFRLITLPAGQDLAVTVLAEMLRRRGERIWIVGDPDGPAQLAAMAVVGPVARSLPNAMWYQPVDWRYDTGVDHDADLVRYAFTRLDPGPTASGPDDVVVVSPDGSRDLARDVACQLVEGYLADPQVLAVLAERFSGAATRLDPDAQLEALAGALAHGRYTPVRAPEAGPYSPAPEPAPADPFEPAAGRWEPVEPSPAPERATSDPVLTMWRRLTGPLAYTMTQHEPRPTDTDLRELVASLERAWARGDTVLLGHRALEDPETLTRALGMTRNPRLADHFVEQLSRMAPGLPRRLRTRAAGAVIAEGFWLDRWPDDPDGHFRRAILLYESLVRTVPPRRQPGKGLALIGVVHPLPAGPEFLERIVRDAGQATGWSDAMWREFLRLDRETAIGEQRRPTLETTGRSPEPPGGRVFWTAAVVAAVLVLLAVMIGCGAVRMSFAQRETGGPSVVANL